MQTNTFGSGNFSGFNGMGGMGSATRRGRPALEGAAVTPMYAAQPPQNTSYAAPTNPPVYGAPQQPTGYGQTPAQSEPYGGVQQGYGSQTPSEPLPPYRQPPNQPPPTQPDWDEVLPPDQGGGQQQPQQIFAPGYTGDTSLDTPSYVPDDPWNQGQRGPEQPPPSGGNEWDQPYDGGQQQSGGEQNGWQPSGQQPWGGGQQGGGEQQQMTYGGDAGSTNAWQQAQNGGAQRGNQNAAGQFQQGRGGGLSGKEGGSQQQGGAGQPGAADAWDQSQGGNSNQNRYGNGPESNDNYWNDGTREAGIAQRRRQVQSGGFGGSETAKYNYVNYGGQPGYDEWGNPLEGTSEFDSQRQRNILRERQQSPRIRG